MSVRSAFLSRATVTVAVAGAMAAVLLLSGALVQRVALHEPSPASLAAVRAATWLQHYRLVDSVFRVGAGRAAHGRCLQTWFGQRRGAVLHLDDGFVLVAVPPHRLTSTGGTDAERSFSPLLLLELGGCPRLLVRRLETLAQRGRGLRLTGGRRPALHLTLQGTRLTVYLEPKSYRPVALDVVGRRARGTSTIHFVPLTPRLQRQLVRS